MVYIIMPELMCQRLRVPVMLLPVMILLDLPRNQVMPLLQLIMKRMSFLPTTMEYILTEKLLQDQATLPPLLTPSTPTTVNLTKIFSLLITMVFTTMQVLKRVLAMWHHHLQTSFQIVICHLLTQQSPP